MKTLVLVFALLVLLAQGAFAGEAELSDIVRPVDAQAQVEEVEGTSGLGAAAAETQPTESAEFYHKEAI